MLAHGTRERKNTTSTYCCPCPGLRTASFICVVDVVHLELLPHPTLLPSSARHHGAAWVPDMKNFNPPKGKLRKARRKAVKHNIQCFSALQP